MAKKDETTKKVKVVKEKVVAVDTGAKVVADSNISDDVVANDTIVFKHQEADQDLADLLPTKRRRPA